MSSEKSNDNLKILIFASAGISTNIVYNELAQQFPWLKVVMENKISNTKIILGRIKRIGLLKTIGQILFITGVVPLLKVTSKNRINEIISSNNLSSVKIPGERIILVQTINSNTILKLVSELKPQLIIVNGTRIIAKEILNNIQCPIINIHVGITPLYRGVHGGYWALYNNDSKNFGTTIHFVDKGIDTGKIIRQIQTLPEKKDNFITYPILQLAIAIKQLNEIVKVILNKNSINNFRVSVNSKGKVWYHPTLFEYLTARLIRNIK